MRRYIFFYMSLLFFAGQNAFPVSGVGLASLGMHPAHKLWAQEFRVSEKHKKARNSLARSLKSSPWYDFEKSDYHKYRAEEIQIPDQDEPKPPQWKPPDLSGLGAFFEHLTQFLFFLLIAVPVIALLFVLLRIAREHWKRRTEPEESALPVEHSTIPDAVLARTKIDGPLTTTTLRKAWEDALQKGDQRLAAIYLYLYALLRLHEARLLDLHKDDTAREYQTKLHRSLKQRIRSGQLPSPQTAHRTKQTFSNIVRDFEYAMYGERLASDANPQGLWEELEKDLSKLQTSPPESPVDSIPGGRLP